MVPVRTWERSSSKVLSNPVQALDRPAASHQAQEVLDAGTSPGETGRVEAGLDTDPDIVEGRRFAFDDDESACVREGRLWRDRYRPGPVAVDAPVHRPVRVVLACHRRLLHRARCLRCDPETPKTIGPVARAASGPTTSHGASHSGCACQAGSACRRWGCVSCSSARSKSPDAPSSATPAQMAALMPSAAATTPRTSGPAA